MRFWHKLLKSTRKHKGIEEGTNFSDKIENMQYSTAMIEKEDITDISKSKENKILDQKLFIPSKERKLFSEDQIKHMETIVELLPPLETETVNFRPWHIKKFGQGWLAQIILRNGSLTESIEIFKVLVTLKDANSTVIANQVCDFTEQEPIPPRSVQFISFIFEEKDVIEQYADVSKWSIDFDLVNVK